MSSIINYQQAEEEEEEDFFDRLPDALVLLIFNKLQDARSLSSSMAVCKRFHSVIPQVDAISLSIPRRYIHISSKDRDPTSEKSNSFKNALKKFIISPLHFLLHILKPKSSAYSSDNDDDGDDDNYYSPGEILKPFCEIKKLELKLPTHGIKGVSSKGEDHWETVTKLKWRAEFGSQLEKCLIVGGTCFSPLVEESQSNGDAIREGDLRMNDDELKLRIVWTISCLIAASARHCLLQQTVKEHQSLQSVVVSDGNQQGKLCMSSPQVEEMRKALISSGLKQESLLDRSRVPALKMKMWYVPELELPVAGRVMKGATLVVVRPVDEEGKLDGAAAEAFDWAAMAAEEEEEDEDEKVFGEAVRKLANMKRSYTLEMNSF